MLVMCCSTFAWVVQAGSRPFEAVSPLGNGLRVGTWSCWHTPCFSDLHRRIDTPSGGLGGSMGRSGVPEHRWGDPLKGATLLTSAPPPSFGGAVNQTSLDPSARSHPGRSALGGSREGRPSLRPGVYPRAAVRAVSPERAMPTAMGGVTPAPAQRHVASAVRIKG